MNEDLSLTDASDKLGVSPNYLSALIKKTKSQNFIALVTERRMKAASDLLLCTSMKIFEISQKCGYRTSTISVIALKNITVCHLTNTERSI